MAKGTYQVKVKQEIYVNVRAESGAEAKRIVESHKPHFYSSTAGALEGQASRVYPMIIRATDRVCDVCGNWQQSVGKGNCWTCRHEEMGRKYRELQKEAQSEGGEE